MYKTLEVYLWDKITPINGVCVERLVEKFTKENGNTDRVLFAYDGTIGRIQYVDEDQFNNDEKANVAALVSGGTDYKQAISNSWALKVKREEDEAAIQAEIEKAKSPEKLQADLCYMAMVLGVDLDD